MTRLRTTLVTLATLAALAACGADEDVSASADDSAAQSPSRTTESTETTESPESADSTRALTADGSTAGKCAVPSAEVLSSFDTAFAGTVTSLEDGTATLAVDEWYAGDEAATVTVTAPGELMQDLLMAVDFEEGTTYLVSATGDRVTLCGFTAEEGPELQALYDEAFGR